MNLYLRLLTTLLIALFERRVDTSYACSQCFLVLPTDIDVFGHMNNGRYLQIMDISRARWMVRTGTFRAVRKRGWGLALGGNLIRYRRPLRAGQQYTVSTRLVCWDKRWFYLEHAFRDRTGRECAVGVSRATVRDRHSCVPTSAVMQEVDRGAIPPPVPQYLQDWLAIENSMFEEASRANA